MQIYQTNISRIILLFTIFIYSLFFGCTQSLQIKTADDVFIHTKPNTDLYTRIIRVDGPIFRVFKPATWNKPARDYWWLLQAVINHQGILVYSLVICDKNADWKFYDSAYDVNGQELEFVGIDREVKSGFTQELFRIAMNRKYLERARSAGLDIKIIGKRGWKIFTIPAYYVDGFCRKTDTYFEQSG